MSVSSVTGINLARSEFRSLRAFLALYAFLTILIIAVASYLYYTFEKNRMLSQWRLELQLHNESFLPQLKVLHHHILKSQRYPRNKDFSSGIYDIDKKRIFSSLHTKDIDLNSVISLNEGYIQAVFQPEFYYLGAKYVVLEVPDDGIWLQESIQTILLFGSIFFLFMVLTGWYLAKLFLRPMKHAVALLDQFIKDTTHELNTPVAAILNNIETIDTAQLDEKLSKKIHRMEIATRTISTLYEDLTFLVLNHKISKEVISLDISTLLQERLEYFSMHLSQKKITVTSHIDPRVILPMDKQQAVRLFDNLLSNAIKYNKIGGTIEVRLNSRGFIISDSGKGIPQDKLQTIFTRFARADTVEGGFGIGLSIVSLIVKEYDYKIDVVSEQEKGTTFTITW